MAKATKLDAVHLEVIDDSDYRWTYSNTLGGMIRVFRDYVEIIVDESVIRIKNADLVGARFSPSWTTRQSNAYIIFNVGDDKHNFIVDTYTNGYPDIPILVREFQRRGVSSR